MRQLLKYKLLFFIICPSVLAGWSDGWDWSSSESSESDSSSITELSENIDSESNSDSYELIRNVSLLGNMINP